MFEFRKPIQIKEAVERVMKYRIEKESESISLQDCEGRYLAEDVISSHPVPPFDKAPYDGYAIRSEDTRNASLQNPVKFKVIDHIGAGQLSTKTVGQFEAVRIMTGAQIPDGADCVAMFEVTQDASEGDSPFFTLKRKLKKGENVGLKGSETSEGAVLVKKGSRINPGIKALLATFGYSYIKVARQPRVGLFATGTELLDVDEPLVPGKIRNSNAHMISAQIKRAGGIPVYLGKLVDDFDLCFQALQKAIDDVDFLITTGGVSVGDYDLMPEIYDKLGAKVLFNKIAMRPGSVTTVAALGKKLLFGLSGNPSACYVGFELFSRPIIQAAQYTERPFTPKIEATLGTDFPKANPFMRFVRSYIDFEDGQVFVYPAGLDKSAAVTSLADTNALMILPGGTRGYEKGDKVDVLLLETLQGSSVIWE
ncbi:molybdopterin molybdotransferase MoeA [Bacillaceae bacterium S4-13-56]